MRGHVLLARNLLLSATGEFISGRVPALLTRGVRTEERKLYWTLRLCAPPTKNAVVLNTWGIHHVRLIQMCWLDIMCLPK